MDEENFKKAVAKALDPEEIAGKVKEKCLYVAGDTFDAMLDVFLYGKKLQRFTPGTMLEIREFFVDARKGMETLINYIDRLAREEKEQTPED